MLTGSKTPLIWPLLDKLNPVVARQQRPRSAAPLGVSRLPTMPWDAGTPNARLYGQSEGVPTLWDLALWGTGLAALSQQPVRLRNFLNNPRPVPYSEVRRAPGVTHALAPLVPRIAMISGVTRDSAGAILGGCVVELYETASNLPLFNVTSDLTTGAFTFTCARFAPATHYLVAYKISSPDVAGTTVNTLTGT